MTLKNRSKTVLFILHFVRLCRKNKGPIKRKVNLHEN
jgi:hypothetical protein